MDKLRSSIDPICSVIKEFRSFKAITDKKLSDFAGRNASYRGRCKTKKNNFLASYKTMQDDIRKPR